MLTNHPSTIPSSVQPEQANVRVVNSQSHWRGGHLFTVATLAGLLSIIEVPQIAIRKRGYTEHLFYIDGQSVCIGSVIHNHGKRADWYTDRHTEHRYPSLQNAVEDLASAHLGGGQQ